MLHRARPAHHAPGLVQQRVLLRHLLEVRHGERRVEQAHARVVAVLLDARVGEARVLVAPELVHGVVHHGIAEHAKGDEQLEVLHGKASNLLEQAGFQLRDDFLQALLAIVRKVHEHRNARGELYQLLLDLLALGLEFLLFLGELLLLLFSKIAAFFLDFLHVLGLVDNRLDIVVEAAEALDILERLHGLSVLEQAAQRIVVDVDQQGTFPAAGKQRGRRTSHGDIQDIGSIHFTHRATVVGEYGKELDKIRYLFLRTRLVHRKLATVVGHHSERTVECEVEHIAFLLYGLRMSVLVLCSPGTLHAERGLKVRLGSLKVSQHKHAGPRTDGHARSKLAA